MDPVTRVQILAESSAFYIALGEGMNPTTHPPAMGNIVGQTRPFNLGMANGQREEKTLNSNC